MRVRSMFAAILLSTMTVTKAFATDCSPWAQFSSNMPDLKPDSVSISELQNYINGLSTSEGIIFDIQLKGNQLWVDVVYVPGSATSLSGFRAILQMGRRVDGSFSKIVLSDDSIGVYQLAEPTLKELGCQFVWGEEGGQNPIYLMRTFFQNLEDYPNGEKSVSGFTGALLPDTSLTMQYHNEVFLRKWLLSAVQ